MAGSGNPVSVMDSRFREVGQGEAALKGAARSLVEALFDAVDAPARWMGLKTAGNTAALIETLGLSKPAENQPQAVHDANAFGEAAGLAGPLAAPKAPGAAKALVNAVLEGPRAGSRAGQIGAIRLGGAPDLYATHGVDPGSLYHYNSRPKGQAKWDKELSPTIELSNPSIAIRSNTLSNPFGPDLRLVPRQGAYDPATSASTLFNRDAYTPRAGAFEGKVAAQDSSWRREQEVYGGTVPPGGTAKSRLLDRLFMDPKALHGTEKLKDAVVDDSIRAVFDGSVTRHLGHDVAIASSPAFRSFADYEKLASGAATLRNKEPYESYWFRALNDTKGAGAQYNDMFRKLHDKHDPANSSYSDKRLREVAVRFGMQPASLREDPYAARDWLITQLEKAGYTENSGRLASILEGPFSQAYTGRVKRLMREAPSEYGELKVHGTTPVTGENWAAAMFSSPQAQWSEAERALAQRFHRAGLKVVDNTFGMTGDAEQRLIDKIHGEVGPARKFPIGEPRNFPAAAAQSKLPSKPQLLPPQEPSAPAFHPLTEQLTKAVQGGAKTFNPWMLSPEGQEFFQVYKKAKAELSPEEAALMEAYNKLVAK